MSYMDSAIHARSVLAAAITKSVQEAIRTQHVYKETLAEQSIRDGAVVGTTVLEGEGESLIEIPFPVTFLEKPVFTAGLETAENVSLQWGNFPVWSATVGAWSTEPAENEPLYTGAFIGVFVLGPARSILHYRFEGQSATNPTTGSLNIGVPL
jgi:hypothetical protein